MIVQVQDLDTKDILIPEADVSQEPRVGQTIGDDRPNTFHRIVFISTRTVDNHIIVWTRQNK